MRYGVTRQTVHRWVRWYASGGIDALADSSSRPATCPHQMAPEVEARIVQMRSQRAPHYYESLSSVPREPN